MDTTLVARGLTGSYGERELFKDLDLVVAPGDVIGLVGANGAGKSTLLRILAGIRSADAGTVTVAPANANIGYLAQETERRPGECLREFLGRRSGVAPAEAEMNEAAMDLATGVAGADDRYSESLERWLSLGGADFDDRIDHVLDDIGLDVDPDLAMTSLSGGQAARAGLAALLLSRYDVILLDEPTNDLDAEGLERLEEFVRTVNAPILLISHDREFLSSTVTSVLEIDRSLRRVAMYGGSYDAYLAERSIARRQAREAYEEYANRKSELESRARRQRAWMAKGVKNARRKASDNDKIGRAFRTESSEKQAAKARQTAKMLERLEEVEEPRKEWQLQFTIAPAARSGEMVCVARAAVAERGEFRLGPIDLQLVLGDRVAITGPNGAGKSTLLALLLGRLEPLAGTATMGSGVVIGEIDQAREAFLSQSSVADAMGGHLSDWTDADVRTLLAKFGLGADQVSRTADSLSPGERTRAGLALLQAKGVNLLVLDEPTNHLDLEAIEQLEQALESFDGTLLLVTHDRRMLDTVRLTRRWHVSGGSVTEVDAP